VIIALTIAYEAGDFSRFQKDGNYLSYCRCVDSKSLSNGKKKGENNRKSGNKYLCWAYVEAANFSKRYCPYAHVYYKHKLKESKLPVLAAKALGSKIARASYHILTTDEPYNPEKLFERYKAEAQALVFPKRRLRQ
jgi:transposase